MYVPRTTTLFGGIERGSGRSFLKIVPCRDSRTLLKVICRYIRPGSIIMSDEWRACRKIPRLGRGYKHFTVNHSRNFVNPVSGAHTQCIESHWQKLKASLKRKYGINNTRIADYMSEFLWRREFGANPDELFFHFWDCIAQLYPF